MMSDGGLEPLITACPHCETRFRVSETQLESADGRVRCGACLNVFRGTECLVLSGMPSARDSTAVDPSGVLDEILQELEQSGTSDADPSDVLEQASEQSSAGPHPTQAQPDEYEDDAGVVNVIFNDIAALAELHYGTSTKPHKVINGRLKKTFVEAVKKREQ